MPEQVFNTWKYAGKTYLSTPNGNGGFSIISEFGDHYGSWLDVKEFRRRQEKGLEDSLALGYAKLIVFHVGDNTIDAPRKND